MPQFEATLDKLQESLDLLDDVEKRRTHGLQQASRYASLLSMNMLQVEGVLDRAYSAALGHTFSCFVAFSDAYEEKYGVPKS